MIYVKVYDKYINKLIDEFKLNTNAEKFSIGDRIVYNKKNGISITAETLKIKAIRHEIAFEDSYEEDVAIYKRTIIEATSI